MILFLFIILIFTFIYLILKKKNKELFNEITKNDLDDLDLKINNKYMNILSEIYKINKFLGIEYQKKITTTTMTQTTKESLKKSKTCNRKSDDEDCKTYDKKLCNHPLIGKKVSLSCPILCDKC